MRESDIIHETENKAAFVIKEKGQYTVLRYPKFTVTHTIVDSAYPKTKDGLSIAICRAEYIAKQQA